MNHTTFPAFGTWYARYASLYVTAPATAATAADVTELPVPSALPALPRLTSAA